MILTHGRFDNGPLIAAAACSCMDDHGGQRRLTQGSNRRGNKQPPDELRTEHAILTATVDVLTAYGALAVCAMLITYALESRSAAFVLAFAAACAASSLYGFLQGAWPFGFVEAVWSVVAFRRWWRRRAAEASEARTPLAAES